MSGSYTTDFRDDPDEFRKRPLPVQYLCCSHGRLAEAAPWIISW